MSTYKIDPVIVGLKVLGVEWNTITMHTLGQIHFDLLGRNGGVVFPIRASALIRADRDEAPIRLIHSLGDARIDQELMRHLLVFHRSALLAQVAQRIDGEKAFEWASRWGARIIPGKWAYKPRPLTQGFVFVAPSAAAGEACCKPDHAVMSHVFAPDLDDARGLLGGFATLGRSLSRDLEWFGSVTFSRDIERDRSLWHGEHWIEDLEPPQGSEEPWDLCAPLLQLPDDRVKEVPDAPAKDVSIG